MHFDPKQRPIVLVGMAAAIPLLLFAGWVTYLTATQERAAARTAAFEALDRVSTRLASEISTQIEIAETLALSASLDKPNLSIFYLEASRLRTTHPLWETVELTDPNGLQLVNLLRPLGEELGRTADIESFQKVVRFEKSDISGIGPIGPISGKRLVAIRTPVTRDGRLRYVLTVHLVPDAVSTILREAGAPPGWIGVVLDGNGNIIARTLSEQFEMGRPASTSARAAVARANSGAYVGDTLEGVEIEAVFRTLPDIGNWSVHLGLPTASLNAPVTRSAFFLGGGGIVSLALAFGLAWLTARDIAQRRRDEQTRSAAVLNVSEERRALAVEAAELGTFSWDFNRRQVLGSHRIRDLFGLPGTNRQGGEWIWPSEIFLSRIHPDDRIFVEKAFERCAQAGDAVDIEFRVLIESGRARWLRAIGRTAQFDSAPKDLVHGVLADIDNKKRAEAERTELLRQMATAQEREQRRIARELHDQIGQTVTGLSLGLKGLEQSLHHIQGYETVRDRVSWLQTLTSKISQDIHQVASELRPSALDDLGLENALSALGAEWSRRFGIAADIQIIGGPLQLSPDIETTIYRIVQEALTNVLKHARARTVSIVLEQRSDQLRIVIEDDGAGFSLHAFKGKSDTERPRQLGISGIRERLALIGGKLSIESKPDAGTTLFIVIPNA